MTPLCTRMYTHPFFEATPPGAAPGPPVENRVPVFATSGGVITSYLNDFKASDWNESKKAHLSSIWVFRVLMGFL